MTKCINMICQLKILGLLIVFSPLANLKADDLGVMKESGRKLYEQNCASCHGPDARGDGPVASSLKNPPANLRNISKRRDGKFPTAEIEAMIDGRSLVSVHGSREMPVWGRAFGTKVGGGEIGEEVVRGNLAVLIEYLKSIQE